MEILPAAPAVSDPLEALVTLELVLMVPLTVVFPADTIEMTPPRETRAAPSSIPSTLTVDSIFSRWVICSAVNGPVRPFMLTVRPFSAMPPSALILPEIEMKPSLESGTTPLINWLATALLIEPSARMIVSRKVFVGVVTDSLPTLTTPVLPTTKPLEFAKKTLPPILPSL